MIIIFSVIVIRFGVAVIIIFLVVGVVGFVSITIIIAIIFVLGRLVSGIFASYIIPKSASIGIFGFCGGGVKFLVIICYIFKSEIKLIKLHESNTHHKCEYYIKKRYINIRF